MNKISDNLQKQVRDDIEQKAKRDSNKILGWAIIIIFIFFVVLVVLIAYLFGLSRLPL